MSLVTRCPKCQSGFEVTADQLRVHDGLVRCGQCTHVFDGYAHLQASLPTLTRKVQAESTPASVDPGHNHGIQPVSPPAASAATTGGQPASRIEPASLLAHRIRIADDANGTDASDGESGETRIVPIRRSATAVNTAEPNTAHEPVLSIRPTPRFQMRDAADDDSAAAPLRVIGEARVRDDAPSSSGRRAPDFMDAPDQERWRVPGVVWLLAVLVLLAVLCVQLAVYFRNDIATSVPMARAALQQLCQQLGCEVSYVRRPERIVIIGSSLQQGEQTAAQKAAQSMPYVLKLTLQNRNDAAQPWPSLLLTLNDASGTVVIRKVLEPAQYLPAAMQSEPFAARQELALELPLLVEGHVISGFEVRRFFP